MDLRSFIATFVAGVFVAICAFYIATRGPIASSQGWTAEGLVTVVLTATTVVLAALGLGVAILAIWGYDQIKDAAATTSLEVATRVATSVATTIAKERAEVVAAREVEARLQTSTEIAPGDISGAFPRDGG